MPIFTSDIEEKNFFQELSFWKIPLIKNPVQFKFDKNWCAETLIIDNNGTSLKKKNRIQFLQELKNIPCH